MTEILLVDDDPGTHKLLSVVLRHQGYEIRVAESAEQAWESMTAHPPGLIIADVHMPGASGLDLLARIRGDIRFALTPVILLTSLRDRQDMRAGMQLGADDYITKPFRGTEIVEAVRAQIGRQAMRQAAQEVFSRCAMEKALEAQAQALGDDYEMKLAHALSEQWPTSQPDNSHGDLTEACICAFGLVDHHPWIQALDALDAARLLRRFHEACGDCGHLFGARLMHFHPDGAVAVFATDAREKTSCSDAGDEPEDQDTALASPTVNAELLALKTAFAFMRSMAGLRDFVRREWPQIPLPPPKVALAIQCGPVGTANLLGITGNTVVSVPVGKGLSEALSLLPLSNRLPESIVMTATTMRKVAGAARIEQRALITVSGMAQEQPVDICWVVPPRN